MNGAHKCGSTAIKKLTSEESIFAFGGNPLTGDVIPASLADTRYYDRDLSPKIIKEAMECRNTTKHYPLISTDHYESTIYEVTEVTKSVLLHSETNEMWIHLESRLTYKEADNACVTYGGNVISASALKDKSIRLYVKEVLDALYFVTWISPSNGKSCTAASVAMSQIKSEQTSCSRPLNAICVVDKDQKFTLIGFLQAGSITFNMLKNKFEFVAEYDFKLDYDTEGFRLVYTDKDLALARMETLVKPHKLMGRSPWQLLATTNIELLTFTVCNKLQFTCSNGFCVPLHKVCDLEINCPDFTDEIFCNFTQSRPSYYNKELSSSRDQKVSLKITLLRIIDLVMSDGTIEIELSANYEWKDRRVVFHNLHQNWETQIASEDAQFYWQPNVIMSGVINDDVYSLSPATRPGQMVVIAETQGIASTFQSQEGKKIENDS